jgi:integrase
MKTKPNIRPVEGKRGIRFEARVSLDGNSKSKTFGTEREATAWLLQTEAAMARGEYSPKSESHRLTLRLAMSNYSKEFAARKQWPQIEQNRIKRLQLEPFTKKVLSAVTSKDIRDFKVARQANGISANTIRLDMTVFSQVFAKARKEWGMDGLHNPVLDVSRPPLPPPCDRRIESDELEKLCAAVPSDVATIIRFGIETTIRRTRLLSIKWKQVDCDNGVLLGILGKNGKITTIPLSPAALSLLSTIPKIPGNDKVFHRSADYISSLLYKVSKRLGLHLWFHLCRHEGTSRLFEKGLRIDQVQVVTQHKTLAMLERYNHARVRDVKAALDFAHNANATPGVNAVDSKS